VQFSKNNEKLKYLMILGLSKLNRVYYIKTSFCAISLAPEF